MSKTNNNYNTNPNIINQINERVEDETTGGDSFLNTANRFRVANLTNVDTEVTYVYPVPAGPAVPYTHDKSVFPNDNVTAQEAEDYLNDNGFPNAAMATSLAAPFDSPETMLETNIDTYNNFASSQAGLPVGYFTWTGL